MSRNALIGALHQLLRPLVRILLRQGFTVEDFEDVARRVYVDVAKKDFVLSGKKQTTSRIGILTGLNRKEVARILKDPMADGPDTTPRNRAQRVMSAWLREDAYLDEKGDPRSLEFAGAGSFSELVRMHSGDMPARAIADELIRQGVLKEEADGRLTLRARAFVPEAGSEELLDILGTHGGDWLDTFDHNMTHPRADARFQRHVIYESIPTRDAAAFRALSARWGQRVLEELDRWLADRKAAATPDEPRVRLGLGIFEIETWPSEQTKD